jgi:hypothetical protein
MTFAGFLKVLNGKIGLGHIFVSKSEKGRRAPRLVVAFVSLQQRPMEIKRLALGHQLAGCDVSVFWSVRSVWFQCCVTDRSCRPHR